MKPEKEQGPEPLALFGGTFDPVHYGHLRCADEVRQKLALETLYLLPAGSPPHRSTPVATAWQRVAMLRLAVAEFPALKVDEREVHRTGPSYMADTLLDVRGSAPRRPLLLLIGQDVANELHSWHRWKSLFELAHIVIMNRPGSRVGYQPEVERQLQGRRVRDVCALVSSPAGGVLNLEVSRIDISATNICEMIREGGSPRTLLPGAVLQYIVDHGLYSDK